VEDKAAKAVKQAEDKIAMLTAQFEEMRNLQIKSSSAASVQYDTENRHSREDNQTAQETKKKEPKKFFHVDNDNGNIPQQQEERKRESKKFFHIDSNADNNKLQQHEKKNKKYPKKFFHVEGTATVIIATTATIQKENGPPIAFTR
jgi:hypothetical protein